MISTCANPVCKKPFHYLRGGRLYRFDAPCPHKYCDDVPNAICATTRQAVFFWLCRRCSSKFTLRFNGREVSITTLDSPASATAPKPLVALGEWETEGRRSPNRFSEESGGLTATGSGSEQG
jgi:hypothetical protein